MFLFPAPNLDDHLELHPNPQIEATVSSYGSSQLLLPSAKY